MPLLPLAGAALAAFTLITVLYLIGIGVPGAVVSPRRGRQAMIAALLLFVVAAFAASGGSLRAPEAWLALLSLPLIGLILVGVFLARPGAGPRLGLGRRRKE